MAARRQKAQEAVDEQTEVAVFGEPAPTTIKQPELGDIVLYVMADGVTLRPGIVVAFETHSKEMKVDLQVFVDGQFDDANVRGAHANATLQDWRTFIPYDGGRTDEENGERFYAPKTWHYR